MHTIRLHTNDTLLTLHGPGTAAPCKGAVWEPAVPEPLPAGVEPAPLRETLTLQLEGAPGQIAGAVASLAGLLVEAARLAPNPGGGWVYLEAQTVPDGPVWRSKVHAGSLAYLRADRAAPSQGIRLTLVRDGWWEDAQEQAVTLENARGLTQSGWNSVSNHADGHAGHTNLLAAPGPFTGDLPAPVRLDLALNEYWPTGLGTLLAAQSVFSPSAGLAGGPVHQVVLEGESGPAYEADGALVDDAGCSGGQYHRLTWTGSYASRVWVRDLPERLVHGLGGRPARLVARLAEPWPAEAGEQTWVTWQLSYVTTTGEMATFYETAGTYLEPGAGWLLGPLLHVPPWHLRAEDTFSAPLRLSLTAQAAGAGLHSLPLDYVSLVPLDGWRIYRPLIGVPGLAFVDDGPAGVLRGSDGAQSHLPEGPGLFVYPGRPACFAFFVQKADGGNLTADIDTTCLVKMYYHPRKALI